MHRLFTPSSPSLEHPVVADASDVSTRHAAPYVPLEALAVPRKILCRLLVQRITGVGFEEQELQAHNYRVEVENGLPVFAQDVQAHVALEVDVRVVDLGYAFYFWRLVWEVLADVEGEVEGATFVHALVGCDCECELQDVVGIGERRCHGAAQREF